MALNKITWADKVTLDAQPDIARINKVIDDDMNEIKSVVNDGIDQIDENTTKIENATTYSTTEQVIGTWIDGKPIYRKIYSDTNVSVSTSNTTIASNFLQNQSNIISISNVVELGNYPYSGNTANWNTLLSPSGDLIMVAFETSRTFNKVNVIVEYTKTTD